MDSTAELRIFPFGLKRRDTRGHFQAVILKNARTVWPRTTKFGRIAHVGEGRNSMGSATPHPKGPSASQFLQFLSIYAYALRPKTTKFGMVTHMARGVFRRSATPLLYFSGFFFCLIVYHIWWIKMNILHLHKCVARFVSDSWVSCQQWHANAKLRRLNACWPQLLIHAHLHDGQFLWETWWTCTCTCRCKHGIFRTSSASIDTKQWVINCV